MTVHTQLRCVACGEPVVAEDLYCEACGTRLADASGDVERKADAGIVAAVTNRGHVRTRNEDAFAIEVIDDVAVAIVCDGVASATAGDRAAQAAAEAALSHLRAAVSQRADADWDAELAMTQAIAAAQASVLDVAWQPGGDRTPPACTFVSAVWDRERITVGSVGDSRAYWITEPTSLQITTDDSWAQEQVDAGLMTASAAYRSMNGHAITRWLGADSPEDPFEVRSIVPTSRGHLVLCSDGLWEYASRPEQLASLVSSQRGDSSSLDIATLLVDTALSAGGRDNVTVAVIDVTPNLVEGP